MLRPAVPARTSHVLLVENDRDIAKVAQAVLEDAGFDVSILSDVRGFAVRLAVEQLDPDCVLLDGESPSGYGNSWLQAEWLRQRPKRIPAIMFTADVPAAIEARQQLTPRSLAASFQYVLTKPFDIDELVEVVTTAARQPMRAAN